MTITVDPMTMRGLKVTATRCISELEHSSEKIIALIDLLETDKEKDEIGATIYQRLDHVIDLLDNAADRIFVKFDENGNIIEYVDGDEEINKNG